MAVRKKWQIWRMYTPIAKESIWRAARKSDEMLEPYEWKRSRMVFIKAIAEFITWLFSGGIIVIMIVAVISVFAVILSSAFAIFFPDSSSTFDYA